MLVNETYIELEVPFLYEIIIAKKKTIFDFKKGGQNLKFKNVKSLGFDFVEIETGVWVRVYKIISKNHFVIECKMLDKSELALHKHSDYKECFKCIKGALFDKYSNTFIDNGITFDKNVWHNLVSIGETRLIIDCIKY